MKQIEVSERGTERDKVAKLASFERLVVCFYAQAVASRVRVGGDTQDTVCGLGSHKHWIDELASKISGWASGVVAATALSVACLPVSCISRISCVSCISFISSTPLWEQGGTWHAWTWRLGSVMLLD
jgi:hypothetical protein